MANDGHDDFAMDMMDETMRLRAQEAQAQSYFRSFPFPQPLTRFEVDEEDAVYIQGAEASPLVGAASTPSAVGEAAAAAEGVRVPNGILTHEHYRGMMRFLREKHGPQAAPAIHFSQGAHMCSASRQGSTGMVQTFIEILDMPVDTRDMCGRSALHMAAMHGHIDLVRYLLDKGADVGAKDMTELTPLHLASWNSHIDIAKLLVERGADVNAATQRMHLKDGRTPLHLASGVGHTDLCRFLINKGANVNATSASGATPLVFACLRDEFIVAGLLLEHGADPTIACHNGITPHRAASFKESYVIMRLLRDHKNVQEQHSPGQRIRMSEVD